MARLFISHASEDKESCVEPLVEELKSKGHQVWYDRFELTIGDSLLRKISEGLNDVDFGVVVLSRNFFSKKWPQAELDGLLAIETTERKMILPIWKDVSEEEVKTFSPILAGRLGAVASGSSSSVVADIERAIQASERTAAFSNVENAISLFKSLDRKYGGIVKSQQIAQSVEGVELVRVAARTLIKQLREEITRLTTALDHLKIVLEKEDIEKMTFRGSFGVRFVLGLHGFYNNTIDRSELRLLIYQNLDPFGMDYSNRREIINSSFRPQIHHSGKLVWRLNEASEQFTTEQLQTRILDYIVKAFSLVLEENSYA